MKLNELSDRPGSRKARKRVGRGIGSGSGKTAGRGGKGQTARTGVHIKGFEGGQMPIYRRLPKRGFNNIFKKSYNEVGLGDVQAAIDTGRLSAGAPITMAALHAAGLVRHPRDGVRILGNGEIRTAATFEVAGASKPAQAAIEKAGGSVKTVSA